jgi:hypothetical protein
VTDATSTITFLQERQEWAEYWLNKARQDETSGSQKRIATYEKLRDNYQRAIEDVKDLVAKTRPLPQNLGDLSDIPPELLSELSGIKTDDLEDKVVTVINSYGGTADLDQVLVALYRKFKLIHTRRFIQNKLWRMSQKGYIYPVPKKKGVYSTKEQKNADERHVKATSVRSDLDDLDDEIPF